MRKAFEPPAVLQRLPATKTVTKGTVRLLSKSRKASTHKRDASESLSKYKKADQRNWNQRLQICNFTLTTLSLCKISQKIPRNFLADTLEKVARFLKDSLHTDIITQKIPTEFSGGYSGESSWKFLWWLRWSKYKMGLRNPWKSHIKEYPLSWGSV